MLLRNLQGGHFYWDTVYVCIYSPARKNTQNIMPEGQQGPEALTAARNKNISNKY